MIPVVVKKKLEELKVVAFSLFGLLCFFCLLLTIQLISEGSSEFNPDKKSDHSKYFEPESVGANSFSALSVILVAFSCQQNLFPIYSELREKNERNHTIVFSSACVICGVLYTAVSIVALYMFGAHNAEKYHTVLDMISYVQKTPKGCQQDDDVECKTPWESFTLRIIFVVVLFCHIPFTFFSGKEAILIAMDEVDRKAISRALEMKIDIMKKAELEEKEGADQ